MKLIVITQEKIVEEESEAINRLCEEGLTILHLRKPDYPKEAIAGLLREIRPEFHNRIVLHDHFSLAEKFDIKGIHLNRRNPESIKKEGITVSKSCHSIDEIEKLDSEITHAFLSPVFDSISKTRYKQAFTKEELLQAKDKHIINEKIMALGGITPENIPTAKELGFGGVAVLGSLWGNFFNDKNEQKLVERFKILQSISNQ